MSISALLDRRKGEGSSQSTVFGIKEDPMPSQKYLVVLKSVPGQDRPPAQQPKQEFYAAFTAWQAKYGANIVDMGGKLKPGGKILTHTGVTDGPFTEAKELIGGFMIVAADNFDQAVEIARECPGVVRPGSIVEIREIATP